MLRVKKLEPNSTGGSEYLYKGNDYDVFHFKNHEDEDSKFVPLLGDQEVENFNKYYYEQIGRPTLRTLDDYGNLT